MRTLAINSELHRRFCEQLKAWREYHGWTQTELAKRLKVKPSVVSQLESGRYAPRLDTVETCSKVLGLEVGQFLFDPPPSHVPDRELSAV